MGLKYSRWAFVAGRTVHNGLCFFLICISWAKNQLMGRKTVEKTAERKEVWT